MKEKILKNLEKNHKKALLKPDLGYTKEQIEMIYNLVVDTIDKLEGVRDDRDLTRDVIKEQIKTLWDSESVLFETWLLQAIDVDITYIYAFNFLAQKMNRENGVIMCRIKDELDVDLPSLLEAEVNNSEDNGDDDSDEEDDENNEYDGKIKLMFNPEERREGINKTLKVLFKEKEEQDDFKRVLEGEDIGKKLRIQCTQNIFVDVFRRLLYNHILVNEKNEVIKWLCNNFEFIYKKGDVKEVRPLNKVSVSALIYRGSGEPNVGKRIDVGDWLPYKSQRKIKEELDKEKNMR